MVPERPRTCLSTKLSFQRWSGEISRFCFFFFEPITGLDLNLLYGVVNLSLRYYLLEIRFELIGGELCARKPRTPTRVTCAQLEFLTNVINILLHPEKWKCIIVYNVTASRRWAIAPNAKKWKKWIMHSCSRNSAVWNVSRHSYTVSIVIRSPY